MALRVEVSPHSVKIRLSTTKVADLFLGSGFYYNPKVPKDPIIW